ncbi:MAG: META domain-containing protein [Halomonas sp.]|nr:META domain-containing protein [Halomonas sp.]
MRIREGLILLTMVGMMTGCSTSRPLSEAERASQAAMRESPLVGERWEMSLIGTDEWWQGGTEAYFTLLPKGNLLQLSGSDGCHPLHGEATLSDGRRIAISGLATSRPACPGQPQASRVVDILARAHRYLVDHDRLVLMGRDGHVLGGFERRK